MYTGHYEHNQHDSQCKLLGFLPSSVVTIKLLKPSQVCFWTFFMFKVPLIALESLLQSFGGMLDMPGVLLMRTHFTSVVNIMGLCLCIMLLQFNSVPLLLCSSVLGVLFPTAKNLLDTWKYQLCYTSLPSVDYCQLGVVFTDGTFSCLSAQGYDQPGFSWQCFLSEDTLSFWSLPPTPHQLQLLGGGAVL